MTTCKTCGSENEGISGPCPECGADDDCTVPAGGGDDLARLRAEKAEARIARMEPVAALAAKIVEAWEYMDAKSPEFFELIKKMRTAIEKHEEVEP